jgi:hypothetical protein
MDGVFVLDAVEIVIDPCFFKKGSLAVLSSNGQYGAKLVPGQ